MLASYISHEFAQGESSYSAIRALVRYLGSRSFKSSQRLRFGFSVLSHVRDIIKHFMPFIFYLYLCVFLAAGVAQQSSMSQMTFQKRLKR